MANRDAPPDIDDIVRRAWCEVFHDVRYDPALNWAEAGGDSMRGVILALLLEEALGSHLPFETMPGAMTPAGLARALAAARSGTGRRPSSEAAEARTRLFVLPGLYGDDRGLVRFRAAASCVAAELVELPRLDRPRAVLSDLGATGEAVGEEIARRQPSGALHLAGHGFGGLVAWEAAHWLIGRGRGIGLVTLLDSGSDLAVDGRRSDPDALRAALDPRHPQHAPDSPARRRRAGEPRAHQALRALLAALLHVHAMAAAGVLTRLSRRVGARLYVDMRQALLARHRLLSLDGWRARTLDAPVLLVESRQSVTLGSTAGWRRRATDLSVVGVGGTHLDLFEPPQLDAVVAALHRAVEPRAALPDNVVMLR